MGKENDIFQSLKYVQEFLTHQIILAFFVLGAFDYYFLQVFHASGLVEITPPSHTAREKTFPIREHKPGSVS
jgi:hypothetical protein